MSQQWKTSDPGPEDDVQMPLGTGESAVGEESYAEKKPRFNSSTLTLVAAFAAALVALYLLGLGNKPRTANAEKVIQETKLSNEIKDLIDKAGESASGLQGDIQRLVAVLTTYLNHQQSASIEIADNPFEREVVRSPFAAELPKTTPTVASQTDDPNLRKVAEYFNGLKIQSVIIGPTPVAMVNNGKGTVMINVGGKLGDLTVTAIQSDRILLKYKENVFELKSSGRNLDQ